MRTVESIYLSKLCQFENIIEEKASKCSGAGTAFADILSSVQQQIGLHSGVSSETSSGTATVQTGTSAADIFAANVYTGYTGIQSAATGDEIDAAIEKAAKATGLDPDLLRAVIRVESSFDSNAESGAGAQGLMQLMPGTAKELGVMDSFDAEQNVLGGATYLAKQLKRFGDVRLALAAYNTGPGRVASYDIADADDPDQYDQISKGVRGYVNKVLQYYEQYKND